MDGVAIRVADPFGPDATALVADFFAEIAARYPGFDPATQPPAPLDAFTTPRGGVLLIATVADAPAGCAGMQRLDSITGEVRRVFVRKTARGHGAGRALLAGLAEAGRDFGYQRLRLDTGDRLAEALQLFRTAGFRDIDDYNRNPYAAHWMELTL